MTHVYLVPARDKNTAQKAVETLINQAVTNGLDTRIFHEGSDETDEIVAKFEGKMIPVASDSDLKRGGKPAIERLTRDHPSDVAIIVVNPTTHAQLFEAYPHTPMPTKKAARKKRTASAGS